MDLIFGTYRCPDHEPESLGVEEPISRSYLGQLLHPFTRHKTKPDKPEAKRDEIAE